MLTRGHKQVTLPIAPMFVPVDISFKWLEISTIEAYACIYINANYFFYMFVLTLY